MKSLAYVFAAIAALFALGGLSDSSAFLFALIFFALAVIFACLAAMASTRRDKLKLESLQRLAGMR